MPDAYSAKILEAKAQIKTLKGVGEYLFFGICIVCYIAEVFNIWRIDLFILSTEPNQYKTEI